MEKITIELEAKDAAALLSAWEKELAELHKQREEIGTKIMASQNRVAALKAKLNGQASFPSHLVNPLRQPSKSGAPKRSPRGLNLKLIEDYLTAAGIGKTTMEIARAVNIGVSSVHAVLTGKGGKFEKDSKGGWKLKR